MIYSQWQTEGGYKYFEGPGQHPIGDDLPDIQMRADNRIGIPSQAVGQPLPSGARVVGSGVMPKGIITPAARPGRGLGASFNSRNMDQKVYLVAAIGILLGAGLVGMADDKKRARRH